MLPWEKESQGIPIIKRSDNEIWTSSQESLELDLHRPISESFDEISKDSSNTTTMEQTSTETPHSIPRSPKDPLLQAKHPRSPISLSNIDHSYDGSPAVPNSDGLRHRKM